MNRGSYLITILAAVKLLLLSNMCAAQMVGPTPQPPGVPVTLEQAAEVEVQNWAVHGQSTFTWMLQPAFHARYTGPQSLRPGANGRETFDATLYAGFRPWAGGEIWINPEVDQGFCRALASSLARIVPVTCRRDMANPKRVLGPALDA